MKLVWNAITNHQHEAVILSQFKPEVGFEIQFDVPHNDKIYQHLWKVTDVVPVRKNAYSWKSGGHSGDSVVRASSCSTKGGKTRLRPLFA
jgi:hypothetical protein